jgi:dihydrofolate reductase
VQVQGSGALILRLPENDLVDEMTLLIVPVVIGQGTSAVPDSDLDLVLDLVDSKGVRSKADRPARRPQWATD